MQIKEHRVIPSAPTTYVCPTPSSNSFSVWSKRQFSDNLQCRVKPSKYGGGRFFKIICSVYFERFNRIDRTLDILASIPAPNSIVLIVHKAVVPYLVHDSTVVLIEQYIRTAQYSSAQQYVTVVHQ